MRTFYYYATKNFGDRMNAWMWPRLVPELLSVVDDDVLVGIGSLIKSDLAKVPGRKIIFGTGSGYGPMPMADEVAKWKVYCVRGPLTARFTGLATDRAVVDSAWLIDLLPEFRYVEGPRDGTIFIPHWTTDLHANWRQPCADAGITYVSPHDEGDAVLGRIASAKLAIVESLHGAILADYYRTPWIAVSSHDKVLEFKWLDFCEAVGVSLRQIQLPVTDMAERLLTGNIVEIDAGTITYLPKVDVEEFAGMPSARATPVNWQYRLRNEIKAFARPMRSAFFSLLEAVRRSLPVRKLFRRRSRRLALLLQSIAQEPANLSQAETRERLLIELAARLDAFRADHGLPPLSAVAHKDQQPAASI